MPSSNTIIRPATNKDFTSVQQLNAELFRFEDGLSGHDHSRNLDWPNTDFAIKYFQKCCATEGGYAAFIAECNSQIIGYLASAISTKLYLATNPIAEIENMFIKEAYRQQGIGSQLVAAFKDWATDQGAHRLKVGAFAYNHSALNFYRKHGFTDFEVILEQPL